MKYIKEELKDIVKFIKDDKHSMDDQSKDYLSDGEVLDIVTNKLNKLIQTSKHEVIWNKETSMFDSYEDVGGWIIVDVETIYGELQEDGDITGDYSDEFGQRVMSEMEKEFDASIGMNWNTIREIILKLKNKQHEKSN